MMQPFSCKTTSCTVSGFLTWFLFLMTTCLIHEGYSAGDGDVAKEAHSGTDGTPHQWPGHLEPLAARAIKRPLPVLQDFPSPPDFFRDYVLPSRPVVFQNGAKSFPAFEAWTDDGLRLRPESDSTMVQVELAKKEDRDHPYQDMSFTEFLERYEEEDIYVVSTLPRFLRKDVLLPPPLVCDDVINHIKDVVLWFSSGGTKSVLHSDSYQNINCLFSGQKEILFINNTRYRNQIKFDRPKKGYSTLDVESVDMEKYPFMRNVEFYYVKMLPGDCIYIPRFWIHQVNSVGRNMAVNVWWNHSIKIPTRQTCGEADSPMTIADVFEANDKLAKEVEEDIAGADEIQLSDEFGDFILKLGWNKTLKINKRQFAKLIRSEVPFLQHLTWTAECDTLTQEIFDLLDVISDGSLTEEDWEAWKNGSMDDRSETLDKKVAMFLEVKDKEFLHKVTDCKEDKRVDRESTPLKSEAASDTDGASSGDLTGEKENESELGPATTDPGQEQDKTIQTKEEL